MHDRDALTDTAVIIPVHNGERYVGELLESLTAQDDKNFSVVIADNGSLDKSMHVVESFRGQFELTIVDASMGSGKAYALNRAISSTPATKLLFVDQDDTVQTSYVSAMDSALDNFPLVAAKMDSSLLNNQYEIPPRFAPPNQKIGQFAIKVAAGGTLGARRCVFDKIGLFDETFDYSTNDVEFCCRAHYAGYDMQLVENATVNYRFRKSLIENYRQGVYYGIGNFAISRIYPEVRSPQKSLPGLIADMGVSALSFAAHRATRARDAHNIGKSVGQVGALLYRS